MKQNKVTSWALLLLCPVRWKLSCSRTSRIGVLYTTYSCVRCKRNRVCIRRPRSLVGSTKMQHDWLSLYSWTSKRLVKRANQALKKRLKIYRKDIPCSVTFSLMNFCSSVVMLQLLQVTLRPNCCLEKTWETVLNLMKSVKKVLRWAETRHGFMTTAEQFRLVLDVGLGFYSNSTGLNYCTDYILWTILKKL